MLVALGHQVGLSMAARAMEGRHAAAAVLAAPRRNSRRDTPEAVSKFAFILVIGFPSQVVFASS
jgi:hypothetical protein